MKKINSYYFALVTALFALSSCATTNQPNLYADFVGFSDDATFYYANKRKKNKPFDLNNSSDKAKLQAAIKNVQQGTNTCATYALDIALDRVKSIKKEHYKKNDNAKFYIVMLTDGIDNNSVDLAIANKKIKKRDLTAYQAKLQKRMAKIYKSKRSKNPFQSYVLLYKGNDINTSKYTDEELIDILTPYTGAKNAPKPNPILDDDIDRLLGKFTQELKSSSFTFRVQKSYRNQRIKMYLNEGADDSKRLYFEADVKSNNKRKEKFELNFIEDKNSPLKFKYDSNSYSEGDTWIDFTINNIRNNSELYEINHTEVEQWVTDNSGKYRQNSEYRANLSQYKDAYVLVILDSSKSFTDIFKEAQDSALKIVDNISNL